MVLRFKDRELGWQAWVPASPAATNAQTSSLYDRCAGGLKKGRAAWTGCRRALAYPEPSPSLCPALRCCMGCVRAGGCTRPTLVDKEQSIRPPKGLSLPLGGLRTFTPRLTTAEILVLQMAQLFAPVLESFLQMRTILALTRRIPRLCSENTRLCQKQGAISTVIKCANNVNLGAIAKGSEIIQRGLEKLAAWSKM